MEKILEKMYKSAAEYYNIYSSEWSMLHEHYSRYVFCKENRKDVISEYLFWENLVDQLKRNNILYYQGIDTFLDEYRDAVNSCLNKIERERQPDYIAYIWKYGNKTAMKSQTGENYDDFLARVKTCYPEPDWYVDITEFHPVYD